MNSGTAGGHITNITFSAGSRAEVLPSRQCNGVHISKMISNFFTHQCATFRAVSFPFLVSFQAKSSYFNDPLIKNDNFCIYYKLYPLPLALQMF